MYKYISLSLSLFIHIYIYIYIHKAHLGVLLRPLREQGPVPRLAGVEPDNNNN